MSYEGIIFLTLSALVAIGNLCGSLETWMGRRKGVKIRYSNVPFASLLCGVLAWIKGAGLLGSWAFLPAALDPGTWMIFILAWKAWARRSNQAANYRNQRITKKNL